jgi:DNA-binding MarR family transcriptional regulator
VTAADEARRLLLAKAWKRSNDVPGKVFGDAMLFVNPPLNILLDLYISYREGHAINVSSVCLGSGAPPTTDLRYIARLMEMGLLRKTEDLRDHRVQYVALTSAGLALTARMLDGVAEADRKLGLDRVRLVR